MRILINYLGKSNSGPVVALEMAKGFVAAGHSVTALISTDTYNLNDWNYESDKIKLCKIPTYSNKGEFVKNTFKFVLNGRKKTLKLIGNSDFDVIINPMHHFWSFFVCRWFDSRVISVCHDPVAHEGEMKVETFLTHKLMKRSDDIIVLTKKFVPIIEEFYGLDRAHIYYMPHGILDIYRKKRCVVRKNLYHKAKWHLLFFGRIEEYKGIEVILKAFELLCVRRDDVDLMIAGQGDIEKYSHLMNNKKITVFNNYIPDSAVADYFDNENVIVVLPYISASQSGIVAIALDFGNLIVASDVGGLYEQLGNGRAGVFAKANDPLDLCVKIDELIENEELQQEQRKQINALRNELNWNTIIGQLSKELFAAKV